ncbi:unnamed protein product [Ceratitis capitata]|uniref:(Mediterranean fruit fly) hypothetical protein n=1 Tax=Ceratitis capitata TaxID=7213 RepID=A0A811U1W3_CERCA|nr:unnamed protein product [Ceratitis capitata]
MIVKKRIETQDTASTWLLITTSLHLQVCTVTTEKSTMPANTTVPPKSLLPSSSDLETLQFQLTCEIPHIKVRSQYRSTGVLILVKASGAGDYWGEYDGVKAKIYFKAIPNLAEDGRTYLTADQVKMDFNVKEIKMGVDNIANGNTVIQAALNLFINSNAQELLKEMKPALRTKLTQVIRNFMDRIFAKIPLDLWINLN